VIALAAGGGLYYYLNEKPDLKAKVQQDEEEVKKRAKELSGELSYCALNIKSFTLARFRQGAGSGRGESHQGKI
jgi:hypothetical protein